ncbi:MAG: acyl-CoA dehydrogenase [Pseudomonadota bacterium]
MSEDLDHLKDWIGRSETIEDRAAQLPVHGYAALRDLPDVPREGDPIGPMGHWFFFKPVAPASKIGPDGHPERGGFMQPVPRPRRMFCGALTNYHKDLIIGEKMKKVQTITGVEIKEGRTGTLVICTVKNDFHGENGLALEEEHDIVYRGNPPADAKDGGGNSGKTRPAPDDHEWIREITPDPVMLFRYSAITFNGHRIHYDRTYVTEVEGYPGLIVHGPLTAGLLLDVALDNNPGRTLAGFSFQARAPLFDTAPFQVAGKPADDGKSVSLWSVTPEGTVGTLATATFE